MNRPEGSLSQREARYADLLNGVDAIIWEADAETWEFTYVNQKAEDLLGYPISEWLGDPDFWLGRLVHPEDREHAAAVCRRASEAGLEHEIEYRAIAADGRIHWLHDRVRGVPAAPGGRRLLRGVMMDVTARRQMADALRENEERLSRLAATSPDAIVTVDEDSIITFLNPAAETLFGYTRDELLGQPLLKLIPERFRDSHLNGMARYARTGERRLPHSAAALVGLTSTGAEIPIEIAFGEYWKAGERYFTGFIRDLTERQRRESELHESQELFREITETISGVFWLTDPIANEILFASPAYEKIWGRSLESLFADPRSWLEAVHPEDRDRVKDALERMSAGGYDIEFRIVRPDGTVRWIRDRASPIREEGGVVMRIAGVSEDITPSVVAARELRESEERLRLAALATQDAIWDWDLATGRDTWSQALSDRFGYPADLRETDGNWWGQQIHPEDHDRVMESIHRAIRTRERKWAEEYRFRRADGSWAHVFDRGYIVVNGEGEPTRMIGAMMDQTEWHESRMALKESEERFRALIEHSAEIITILDKDGNFLYKSPATREILGYEPEELIGKSVFSFLHPEDREHVRAVFERVTSEPGFTTVIEFRFRRKDGGWSVLSSISNNALSNPAVQGVVANSHDVTRERLRDAHLRRAERLASIGTLVGGVAHELNNPLHAIMGFANLMLMESHNEDEKETIETIRREARRAAKIVSELRLLARQTQETAQIHEKVDLNDVVTHVVKVREYQFRAHNIEVSVDLAENLGYTIGDPGQLEQVVLNLVVNAEQALQAIASGRRISIRTHVSGTGIEFRVTDNGPGIARENFDRLFDPFWTTKQPGEGTGLGLSLAHSIVMEHGGRIQVNSQRGQGATFTVYLPSADATAEPSLPASVTADHTAGPTYRVLVVEDEEPVRRLLERQLKRWGHTVQLAVDGREALARITAAEAAGEPCQIVLSDLRMPGMSGEIFLENLRERGGGYENRIAFLTGDVSSRELERVVADGEIPILQKPYEPEKLRAIIELLGQAGNFSL